MLVFEIAITNRDKLVLNQCHSRLIKLSNNPSGRKAMLLFGSIPWKHRLIRVNFSISWFIQFFAAGHSFEKVSVPLFFFNPSYCFFSVLLFLFSCMTTLSFEMKKGRPRVVAEYFLNSYFQKLFIFLYWESTACVIQHLRVNSPL